MARYPSGKLALNPKSYDRRGESFGGLAGTALRVAGLRKLPGCLVSKHVPNCCDALAEHAPLGGSCITEPLPSS